MKPETIAAGDTVAPLADRVALVTGGSRGLGAEIARALARQGSDVAITFLDHSDAAGEVLAAIQSMGRKALVFQAETSQFELAHQVVEKVIAQLGGLDILVCNAGIARDGLLVQSREADWDQVIAVTLKGSFNYIHAAAPHMMRQKRGKIICIGSINGLRGRAGSASYNAAKAGLVGLVKTAAIELGEYEINVNLVAPGFIETPSQAATPEAVRQQVLSESAIKRLGKPEDIAPLVAFLASDAARHITGQVIKADAGQYL